MTSRPIHFVPAEDIPGAQIAGATDTVYTVNITNIDEALNLARGAFKGRELLDGIDDNAASLRNDINKLSDALTVLAPELYNLLRGIENGRIGVLRT